MSITETPLTPPVIFINGAEYAPDFIQNSDKEFTVLPPDNFTGPVTLTFTTDYTPESTATNQNSPANRAEIRYTLNGKNPNLGSKLYTTPVTLTENKTGGDNTIVKVRVYFHGDKSPVSMASLNIV